MEIRSSIITLKKLIKYILLGSIIGIFTGIFCGFLLNSLYLATNIREKYTYIIFLLPIGGAFISFLYYKYGKNSLKGNNLIIENINEGTEDIPLRMGFLVFIGTFVTHLFGGSAGREGSGVQIGGAVAAKLSRILKLNEDDKKIMLLSGVASGFGGIFGTPIAGTIFALEVSKMGKMSYEAIIPSFFSAFIGNEAVKLMGAKHSHYVVTSSIGFSTQNIIKVLIMSAIFGLISSLFSFSTHRLKNIFSNIFKNPMIKSFIGGIIIILLCYIVGTREYLGLSLPLLSEAFIEPVGKLDFLIKLIFTVITLGAAFQGGEVTPLFVIGATLGNVLACFLGIPISFGAALGLIAVFSGATNTPIASFIMGIELFGANGAPYMFMVCIMSYFFSINKGIYTSQLIEANKHWIKE